MRWILSVMATFLVGVSPTYAQDDLTNQARALVVIAETANSICYSVSQGGRQNATSLSGESTAKLNDASAKVADLNVKGSAQITSTDYQGLFQGELASALNNSQNCKKSVFDVLVVKLLPTVTSQTGLPGTQGIHLTPRTVEQPSPGVDCRNTNEPIEDLLCADADLAKADGRMGRLYQQRMQQLSAADKTSLRQQQRNWIRLRDATCNIPISGSLSVAELAPTKPCILKLTQQRTNDLVQ
jgi:uncharacterized protein YecT (DUF1311 family)